MNGERNLVRLVLSDTVKYLKPNSKVDGDMFLSRFLNVDKSISTAKRIRATYLGDPDEAEKLEIDLNKDPRIDKIPGAKAGSLNSLAATLRDEIKYYLSLDEEKREVYIKDINTFLEGATNERKKY